MKTYEARISKAGGGFFTVTIRAENMLAAKEQLEAQYGQGNVTIVRDMR